MTRGADARLPPPNVDLAAEIERHAARRRRSPILAAQKPDAIDQKLTRALPREGAPIDAVLDELDAILAEHARRNAHPGFFGYLVGPGAPTDALAHAIAATVNQNVTGAPSAPGASAIERLVIDWVAELAGFPKSAGGLFASGGSIATLIALASALHKNAGPVLRKDGLPAVVVRQGPFFVYCAETAHFSVERAAILLGLGAICVRKIPIGDDFKIIPSELARLLDYDRGEGKNAVAVVASAGTTTLGVIDPIDAIATVCAERDVWLHVDAAYGGAALLSPRLRDKLRGVERAESFVVDFHKWLYLAQSASALVMRDVEAARVAFATDADYVRLTEEAAPTAEHAYFHLGPETSRPFRALAPWLALRHYGVDRFARSIEEDAACARHLAERVERERDLELVVPPDLSVVCFRFAPSSIDAARADAINARIRDELERGGDFYLSATLLRERPVLRVAAINGSVTKETMDALVDRVLSLGRAALG